MIKIKRVYEKAENADGYRALVDRLWPRGISKSEAKFDLWIKEIAPSNELRKWFNHDPQKWGGFKLKYEKELEDKKKLVDEIKKLERQNKAVTLLYAAYDPSHSNAVVLLEYIKE